MPMAWLRAFSGVSLVVPYYHMVTDAPVPHVSHLFRFRTIGQFKSDVEFILQHFDVVTLDDIVDSLNQRKCLSRPSVHLTFDDGFREMYEIVAPILERAGTPATFFLNTAFLDGKGLAHHNVLSLLIDRFHTCPSVLSTVRFRRLQSLLSGVIDSETLRMRILSLGYAQAPLVQALAEILGVDVDEYIRRTQPYLSSEQVTGLMRRGFTVGAHSHDHPLYADLPLDDQLNQTRTSVQFIVNRFSLNRKAFAFPHTDRGVGQEFFTTAFSERILDVSFGTAGLVRHFHPKNIERVSMENTPVPAANILRYQFARASYLRVRRKSRYRQQ